MHPLQTIVESSLERVFFQPGLSSRGSHQRRRIRPIRFLVLYVFIFRIRTVAATVLLGTLFSLAIEIVQFYIPTRDSGTTDILTNTLGTVIGITLYRWRTIQALLGRLEFPKAFGRVT